MESTEKIDGVEILPSADEQAFASWLSIHHTRHEGVRLKPAKKGTGIPSLTSGQAVDVGLCYGWISGQRRGLDERYYLQKYVPRRPGSLWSQVNVRATGVYANHISERPGSGRRRKPLVTAPGLVEHPVTAFRTRCAPRASSSDEALSTGAAPSR